MKDTARRKDCRQEGTPQLALMAMLDARATLHEAVVRAGITVLGAMLEEDRTKLCGPRYAHDDDRRASRAGYADGELAMGSRLVRMRRPRVRSCDGEELALPTWERYARQDPLTPRAVEQMVLGVSTRNYARSVGSMPAGIAGTNFATENSMSRAMQSVLDLLHEHHLEKESSTLKAFYDSVKLRAEGISNSKGKQKIVLELYDKFFSHAFEKMSDRLGMCTRRSRSLTSS